MPMPQVHFAVGMGMSSVLGIPLLLLRRRWLIWLPLVMTLCGGLALVPDILTRGHEYLPMPDLGEYEKRAHSHSSSMDVFFLHPWLDKRGDVAFTQYIDRKLAGPAMDMPAWMREIAATQPGQRVRGVARKVMDGKLAEMAFQAIALAYLLAACGYAAYIRWGMARAVESAEAMECLRRWAAGYRALGALAGIVPLLIMGVAVGWVVRTMQLPGRPASDTERREKREWVALVERRMGIYPGAQLGLAVRLWDADGAWLRGDLEARTTFSGGAARLAEVVERARANGCDFVVLADAAAVARGEQAAYATELKAAAEQHRGLTILGGLPWDAPVGGGMERTIVLVPPKGVGGEVLADFHKQFDRSAATWAGASSETALRWLHREWIRSLGATRRVAPVVFSLSPPSASEGWTELFSWRRTNELFAGIIGLREIERGEGARRARSRWDPRVAQVGDAWDQLLDGGFRIWGAAAASGFRDPRKHFWPGEFARTHVWCRGRGPEDLLEALRGGCFWAEEGGIVRLKDFEVLAPVLDRPARMGEVARVAPGDEVTVGLVLEVPPSNLAEPSNRLDVVELISNFEGQPKVVRSFQGIRGERRLEHTFPPAQDNNGGLGFYVRARGWRDLERGSRLCFYTNPIQVLVREGSLPPAPSRRTSPQVVSRPSAEPPRPGTAQPAAPAGAGLSEKLKAIGLPPSVRPLHVETFQRPPSRHWRGTHTSYVGDRGPAIADEDLRIELIQSFPLGEATRLFFRCYAAECSRLTLLLRSSTAASPYRAIRELPEKQWVELDLALAEDLQVSRGGAAPLRGPAVLEAIEWRADKLGPLARFHVSDFVLYEPTPASRHEVARRRLAEVDLALREALAREITPTARQKADALKSRLVACRALLDPKARLLPAGELAAVEGDLATLAEDCRRLRLQAAMARATGQADPKLAVGVAGPMQRLSAGGAMPLAGVQFTPSYELAAAAGEEESFQLVVVGLWDKVSGVEVIPSELVPVGAKGPPLPASAVSMALIDDVQVRPRPDLVPGQAGRVADLLLPLHPFDIEPGTFRSVLVTVAASSDLMPGDYEGTVMLRAQGQEPVRVTVRLRRWDFALPAPRLSVIGPLDERAIRQHYRYEKAVPQPRRRELYELLLRYRVDPVLLLSSDEAADMEDITFCLERGLGLAILHESASAAPGPGDAGIARAARYASRIRDAGWGRRGALLLPRMTEGDDVLRIVGSVNALAREHPGLLVITGGEDEPPANLLAYFWRRPLGADPPSRPVDEVVEARLSRSARRAAWELVPAPPESPLPNLLLTNPLIDARVLPWLAWRHGIRALVLHGVTRWQAGDLGDGVLVHPGPDGVPCASLRLMALRDGIEDYEYLWLLWDRARLLRERAPGRYDAALQAADRLAAEVAGAMGSFQRPCRDPHLLASLRARLAREIERLEAAWWAEVDAADDLPPPPAQVSAKAGDEQVTLAWSKSPEAKVTGYSVFRSCDPKGGFVRLNSSPVEALTYTDRAARNGLTYYYFVRSCREKTADGPRSDAVEAAPRAAAKVVWLPSADLTAGSVGPYRVRVRLQGPDTGGILPLVVPQVDYALSDAAFDGFEDMLRHEDGTWSFDVPDLGWSRHAGKKLRIQVRIADRKGRVVTPAVERAVLIDAAAAPRR
jgi:hypothetical protein